MDVGFDAADRVDVDAGSVDAFASKGVVRDGFDLGDEERELSFVCQVTCRLISE